MWSPQSLSKGPYKTIHFPHILPSPFTFFEIRTARQPYYYRNRMFLSSPLVVICYTVQLSIYKRRWALRCTYFANHPEQMKSNPSLLKWIKTAANWKRMKGTGWRMGELLPFFHYGPDRTHRTVEHHHRNQHHMRKATSSTFHIPLGGSIVLFGMVRGLLYEAGMPVPCRALPQLLRCH